MNTDTRSELLERLAALEEAALQVRRELNRHAPALCLPVEVLMMIFQYCPCFDPVRQNRGASRAWTVVLHICQRWRQVAMQTPALWTTLALPAPLDFVEAALEHSRNSWLHVTIHEWRTRPPALRQVQLVFAQAQRVRAWEWYAHVFDVAALPTDAALSRCHTFKVGHIYGANNVLPWDVSPLPGRAVHRGDVFGIVKTLLSLRHLAIGSYNPVFSQPMLSIHEVLHALAPLQMLETLELACEFENSTPTAEISIEVSLPKLRSLTLSGGVCRCAAMLAKLNFRPSTRVRVIELESSRRTASSAVSAIVIPLLPKIIGAGEDGSRPLSSVAIHHRICDDCPRVAVSGWRCLESALGRCSLPDFSLVIPWDFNAFRHIFMQFPFEDVRSLSLHHDIIITSRRHQFKNVEGLRVNSSNILSVYALLRKKDVLPRLHTLHLDGVELYNCPSPQLSRGCRFAACFHILEHCLRGRLESGRPVRRLLLGTEREPALCHLAALAAIVGDVVQLQASTEHLSSDDEFEDETFADWGSDIAWDNAPFVSDSEYDSDDSGDEDL